MVSRQSVNHDRSHLMGLLIFWCFFVWLVYKQAMILFDTFTDD